MAMNLVSLIMQFVTPSMISKLAGSLGLDRDDAQKAVGAGIPAILAGLASSAANPQNQQRLSDVMKQQSASLDQTKSAIGGGGESTLASSGTNILSSLLGGDMMNTIAGAVGRYAGIDPSTTKSLLAMLAPIVTGVIGQQQSNAGLDAKGLANLLTSQGSQIAAAMPSGLTGMLGGTGLLDKLGSDVQRGTAAASAAAGRLSDMPGYVAAGAKDLAGSAARSSSGGRYWPYLALALVGLLGLGWYLLSHDDRQTVAASRTGETVGSGTLDTKLTDLTAEVTSSVSAARVALQGISDPDSAKAALPKLQQVTAQFDTINSAVSQLPPNARKAVSSVVTQSMPILNQLFDRVLASQQTGEVAKPTIDALRLRLNTLARS